MSDTLRESPWPGFWPGSAAGLLLLGSLLLGNSRLAAHPHVFIDGVLEPRVSPDGRYLEGTSVSWIFDQIYSSQMVLDFDRDRNGKINTAEEESVYSQAFVHLKELNYFLEVVPKSGRSITRGLPQKVPLGTARNFHASIDNGKMIYQFYVPFPGATGKGLALSGHKEFAIFLEDQEYFIAFDSLPKSGLNFNGVTISSQEFMVQNLQWGPYPVRAVNVKGS